MGGQRDQRRAAGATECAEWIVVGRRGQGELESRCRVALNADAKQPVRDRGRPAKCPKGEVTVRKSEIQIGIDKLTAQIEPLLAARSILMDLQGAKGTADKPRRAPKTAKAPKVEA
jgi:hypothetical protein